MRYWIPPVPDDGSPINLPEIVLKPGNVMDKAGYDCGLEQDNDKPG